MPVIGTKPGIITSSTTASCGGYISLDGGGTIMARGVCWSTNPNPTISDNSTNDGTGIGYFNSTISNLIGCGIIYYVRAYATNNLGTTYGNQVTINSGFLPAIPSTNIISDVTINSAVSGGNITDDGGCAIIQKGVCWSINP